MTVQQADLFPQNQEGGLFVFTTILPTMCGCSEQKQSYSPGVLNVNEKRPSVSRALERKDRSLAAMVCGMSSSLIQVTVVPAVTVSVGGENVKLSTCTSAAVVIGAAASGV